MGAFPSFQMHHFQAVVHNDLIYVLGAYSGTCCDAEFGISHVWAYSPTSDSWLALHEIPEDRRRGSTGAAVYNGKIYIVGGIEGGHGDPASAKKWFDEYDPASGQWKILPDAPRVRDHFHATVYNDKLYLIGGRNSSVNSVVGAVIGEIDVYNFLTGSWSTLDSSSNLPIPRGAASAILYQGDILVIGGETFQTLAHNETHSFDPISETWTSLAPMVVGRHGTQAAIYDGAIYLAAGSAQKGGSPELNSVERYEDGAIQLVQHSQSLDQSSWNLVGLPLNPIDNNYAAIYDDIDLYPGQSPLRWDGTAYQEHTDLTIGKAYWIRLDKNASTPQTQTIIGSEINAVQTQLLEGWNMIAGPSCDNVFLLGASTSPTGAIPVSSLYSYDGEYVEEYNDIFQRGRLDQGVGYWVYASNDAILTMDCGGSKTYEVVSVPLSDRNKPLGKFTISDAGSKSRQLLFDGDAHPDLDPDAFHLPPRTNYGSFDARYSDGRRLLDGLEGDIVFEASMMPLRIAFDEAPEGRSGKLVINLPSSNNNTSFDLYPGDAIELNDEQLAYAHIQFIDETLGEQPDAFTVHGNYPNPFNPTTRIVFDLPEDANLDVRVIDMLGREVMSQQVTGISAGKQRSIELDASTLPAGTYVYRVTAELSGESFSKAGRMVLLK